MSLINPGQFRKSLQEKIKLAGESQGEESKPIQIKNNSPESFAKPASSYAASEMQAIRSSVQAPQSTSSLPKDSILNKSVHERMQAWAKDHSSTSR